MSSTLAYIQFLTRECITRWRGMGSKDGKEIDEES